MALRPVQIYIKSSYEGDFQDWLDNNPLVTAENIVKMTVTETSIYLLIDD